MQSIIFTDLDGTLLDRNYSFKNAIPALKLIKDKKIPLIFCTSKTELEVRVYLKKIKINHPSIIENGGAIFIPKDYFGFKFKFNKEVKGYFIIELGANYEQLISVIEKIKKSGIKIKNFSSMSIKEISKITNLSTRDAILAKKREYDEPFILIDKNKEKGLIKIIKKNELNLTKGTRFYHLIGNSNKGKAVKILAKLYRKKYKKITTYGFGDSKNDFEMLDNVDKAYLVMGRDRKYASKKYKKIAGVGPEGFNKEILKILNPR